jgi:hypothetical protein
MIKKSNINPMLKKSLLVIIVLFLVLFVLINFATIRTADHPSESGDNVSHDEGKNRKYGEKEFKKEGSFYAKDSHENPFSMEAFRLGVKATEENLR